MSKRSMISCLAARRDFSVPHKTHVLHRKDWFHNSDKFSIHNTLDCPELHDEIRKLMISSFYKEAPIPLALNLARNGCQSTHDFLNKEINTALNSGTSIVYKDPATKNIISVALNLIWERNEEYKVVGASAKEWHNSASEIVNKTSESSIKRHLQWRKYQFQHIYDMGQKLLKENPEKKYAVYLSTGYINPEFRRTARSSSQQISRLDDYHAHWDLSHCIIYLATTFSKMDDYIQENYPSYIPIDHVKYSDLNLVLEDKKCFQPFEHLGGITYRADFLNDFVYKN